LLWRDAGPPDNVEAAMKTLPPLLFAAAFAAAILAAPAAHAFTFEKNASGDSLLDGFAAGSNPYADPDDKLAPSQNANRFDGGGNTVYQQGGLSLQFGRPRSFDEQYNPNDLFDPLKR
jgi:hypothetical protein